MDGEAEQQPDPFEGVGLPGWKPGEIPDSRPAKAQEPIEDPRRHRQEDKELI